MSAVITDLTDDLWFESLVRGKLPDFQAEAMAEEWDRPLFGELELISLTVEGGDGRIVFRAPGGDLIGWRCGYDPEVVAEFGFEGTAEIYLATLWEAAVTSRPGDPDENGVRWWGVRSRQHVQEST